VFHVPELHVAKSKGDEKSIFMSGEAETFRVKIFAMIRSELLPWTWAKIIPDETFRFHLELSGDFIKKEMNFSKKLSFLMLFV
jgi:hypothetical protein